jgi:hypothetical protein
MTAEQAAIARCNAGVYDVPMTGAWRVIIARTTSGHARTWYYHANDDARLPVALRKQAEDWLAKQ